MVIIMRVLKHIAVICAAFAAVTPAVAQETSVQGLVQLFNRQLEVQKQPLTRSLGGDQSRGLTPITIENVQAEPVVIEAEAGGTLVTSVAPVQTTQPDATDTTQSLVTIGTLQTETVKAAKPELGIPAVSDTVEALVYAKLDADLQVNLQIKFDFDSAVLTRTEQSKLTTLCAAMKQSDIRLFRIIGHTDTSGADEYNQKLSTLRAKEVARHLVQDCGIAAARLETVGLGERFPVNASDTRADENRRVEFQALS